VKRVVHIISGLGRGGAEKALTRLVETHRGNPDYEHVVISLTDMGRYGDSIKQMGDTGLRLGYARGFGIADCAGGAGQAAPRIAAQPCANLDVPRRFTGGACGQTGGAPASALGNPLFRSEARCQTADADGAEGLCLDVYLAADIDFVCC
jgi:hypothetical protein